MEVLAELESDSAFYEPRKAEAEEPQVGPGGLINLSQTTRKVVKGLEDQRTAIASLPAPPPPPPSFACCYLNGRCGSVAPLLLRIGPPRDLASLLAQVRHRRM